jgi:coenzyme F420-0:L-glutamate ligase/coenzyme F420-1:gamma-L-glutamate ligase
VKPGDDLFLLIMAALDQAELNLADGDVLVLAQKIVSKAENRYGYLDEISPSPDAIELAALTEKDPAVVELILQESKEVVRTRPGVIIVEHKLGYVHANAGIDRSNISDSDSAHEQGRGERVLLLPEDSDGSARALRAAIKSATGKDVYIIINDSAGRAWRQGTCGFAIGTAGFEPLVNLIGQSDLFGRPLEVTEVAVADELAAAASFLMGQAAEGAPVVLVRGADLKASEQGSQSLIRPKDKDLFR